MIRAQRFLTVGVKIVLAYLEISCAVRTCYPPETSHQAPLISQVYHRPRKNYLTINSLALMMMKKAIKRKPLITRIRMIVRGTRWSESIKLQTLFLALRLTVNLTHHKQYASSSTMSINRTHISMKLLKRSIYCLLTHCYTQSS